MGSRLVCLFCTIMPAVLLLLLPSSARADATGALDFAWERELPEEYVGPNAALAVYNLRLVGVRTGAAGPELHRAIIRRDGRLSEVSPLSNEGLPSQFTPSAIAASEGTGSIFLGGELDGAPVIFRAEASSSAEVGVWEQLPHLPGEPDPPHSRLVDLHARGTYVYAFTERTVPGGFANGGWAAHGGVPLENFEWRTIPVPERPRTGHAILMTADHLILAGGQYVDPDTGQTTDPAPRCDATGYEGNRFSGWYQLPVPVSPRFTDVLGASGPGGVMVAPRMPITGDNVPTSMTLMMASGGMESGITEFHRVYLDIPQWHLAHLVPDYAHSWLFLIGNEEEGAPLMISAWDIPGWVDLQMPSEADFRREIIGQMVWDPLEIPLDDIMYEAEINERLALVVIPGDDPDVQLEVKATMSNPQFRYQTRNMVYTYLQGENAVPAMSRFGISNTPAYLVIDADGNVAAEHSGSVPRPSEMFQLTSPSRAPVEE